MLHIAFRKSLASGIVSVVSADSWDQLKATLWGLDFHDTQEWDAHFAWENFRGGSLIKDSAGIWKYVNFEKGNLTGVTIFEGELIDLAEVDPLFDEV